MWTMEQRERMALENAILQADGLTQFSVNHDANADSYSAWGYATSNAGYRYGLCATIPSQFPLQRPPLYLFEPNPLLMADRKAIASLGVSHNMHTLTPLSNGMIQLCHWREDKWHSSIFLSKVFLKGLIWIEAYEQHIATGRPLAEFVRTMPEK